MNLPRTLIQLHYHDRTGGVTTVVRSYARAFRHITGASRSCSLVLCHSSRDARPMDDAVVHNLAKMEYREFTSLDELARYRQVIVDYLEHLFTDPRLPKPIAVVGHNLTLGKNCAVSSAFAHLARGWTACFPHIRFYSVIHDFAEEGRSEMLRRVDALESAGEAVWADCYLRSPNLQYVALNKRDYSVLTEAGLPTVMVPNPVDVDKNVAPLPSADARAVQRALERVSRDDGISLRSGAPWFFYPARIIGRKNVAEAIVLACILLRGNLLVGVAGTSAPDRKLYRNLLRLCRKCGLPVILDAPRIGAYLPRRCASHNPFELLYRFAHTCVTTSVAEGFGYALYEPWLYGKCLIGRLPAGFGRRDGPDVSALYDALRVPAAWVDIERLARMYIDLRDRVCPDGRSGRSGNPGDAFVKDGLVDFAVLDPESQMSVAERLARGDAVPDEVRNLWARQRRRIAREPGDHRIVEENRKVVRRSYSFAAFEKKFALCLTTRVPMPMRRGVATSIRRYFGSFGRLRLLLDAER